MKFLTAKVFGIPVWAWLVIVYIVTSPIQAAVHAHGLIDLLKYAGHQLSTFINSF